MSDVDLSHVFPLERYFRRWPWLALVLVLAAFLLGAVLDTESLWS